MDLTKREYMVINNLISEEIKFLQSMGAVGKSGIRTLQNIRNKTYINSQQYLADKREYLAMKKQEEQQLKMVK